MSISNKIRVAIQKTFDKGFTPINIKAHQEMRNIVRAELVGRPHLHRRSEKFDWVFELPIEVDNSICIDPIIVATDKPTRIEKARALKCKEIYTKV